MKFLRRLFSFVISLLNQENQILSINWTHKYNIPSYFDCIDMQLINPFWTIIIFYAAKFFQLMCVPMHTKLS